jgi:hypothetical protein
MAILGLMTSESFSAERFKSIRRSVFYFYPNGAAPLTGLLSLLKDEVTNDPEYKWYEKRMQEQRTTSAAISGSIALYSSVSADFATWTAAAADFALVADSQYGIKVASGGTAQFRVGHLIKFFTYAITSSAAQEVIGRVTYVDATNNRLAFVAIRVGAANVQYTLSANIGVEILVVGNAFSEGAVGSSTNVYNLPVNPLNYTQIFRTSFQITGTALKTSAKFDETGVYKDMSKEAALNHNIEMEKNFIFGEQRQVSVSGTITRYTGGVMWFLRSWEAGTMYGNSAATADTDDNKRIIDNAGGTVSDKSYSNYLERLFRVTNNKSNEKLCLCGSGALNVVNQMYKGQACLNADMPLTDTYGMNVVAHTTPFGKIYYRTHPLFSQNAVMRYNMLFLDVLNWKYRYMAGRDTELLTERQPNNADYREDEWLTEAGLQTMFPESNMYLQNVLDWQP